MEKMLDNIETKMESLIKETDEMAKLQLKKELVELEQEVQDIEKTL